MDDYDLNSTNMTWPELEEMPGCSLCHTINTTNGYHTGKNRQFKWSFKSMAGTLQGEILVGMVIRVTPGE